jgi:hypothetical protein
MNYSLQIRVRDGISGLRSCFAILQSTEDWQYRTALEGRAAAEECAGGSLGRQEELQTLLGHFNERGKEAKNKMKEAAVQTRCQICHDSWRSDIVVAGTMLEWKIE